MTDLAGLLMLHVHVVRQAILLRGLSGFAWLAIASVAFGGESNRVTVQDSRDCAEILMPNLAYAALTAAEKTALLERALWKSLNNFDPCKAAASGTNNGAVGGNSGGDSGVDSGDNAMQGNKSADGTAKAQVIESTSVGDIQGDQSATKTPLPGQNNRAEEITTTNQTGQTTDRTTLPNGKAPQDIPPAGNDNIIAKQFRQAALDEKDLVIKAKLWNEYRRYKNLPVQDVPET